jgi:hypothetical protein
MKKLVFVIIAIAALAAAVYFIHLPQPSAVASLPVAETVAAPRREPALQPNTQDVLPDRQLRPSQTAPPSHKPQSMAECRAMWDDKRKREQAAHDAETKDAAWAYSMEQKLREFASRRFQGASMELTAVDCKTTYCNLVVQVLEPDSATQLYAALEDVGMQPWSDFTGKSYEKVSETSNDYRVELLRQHSYQTPFYEENNSEASLACMRLSSDRALQERAASDAQPRDAAWADQIEPLLRQHIASRTAKHPPEKLEIDCKTTFCRIKASGQTRDSQTLFQQAAQDAAAEPWAELRNGEGGGTAYGDSWKYEVTLHRK